MKFSMEIGPILDNLIKSFIVSSNKLATLWKGFVFKFPFYISCDCVCFGPTFMGNWFDFIKWRLIPPQSYAAEKGLGGETDKTANPDRCLELHSLNGGQLPVTAPLTHWLLGGSGVDW